MDIINKDDFDNTDKLPELPKKPHFDLFKGEDMGLEEFGKLVKNMNHPLEAQKELAARVKTFLDFQTERELAEKGVLTDFTRRWIKTYADLLDAIHKNAFGEKKVNLHLHKVSHGDIANKIRQVGLDE